MHMIPAFEIQILVSSNPTVNERIYIHSELVTFRGFETKPTDQHPVSSLEQKLDRVVDLGENPSFDQPSPNTSHSYQRCVKFTE